MTKPVYANSVVMISGVLYVAVAKSRPHGDEGRHRVVLHKRDAPSETYWAVAQHNLTMGPWKIEGPATFDEVAAAIEHDVKRQAFSKALAEDTEDLEAHYPRGRRVELSELTDKDIELIKNSKSKSGYSLEDLDDDGNLKPKGSE